MSENGQIPQIPNVVISSDSKSITNGIQVKYTTNHFSDEVGFNFIFDSSYLPNCEFWFEKKKPPRRDGRFRYSETQS